MVQKGAPMLCCLLQS